ncbi:MAG: LPS-assembly protein LptD, partial [Sphingomonadaceae bacterium]|nr:LPS-assembly protein LptD [Sphingomonadaceae bacterium]
MVIAVKRGRCDRQVMLLFRMPPVPVFDARPAPSVATALAMVLACGLPGGAALAQDGGAVAEPLPPTPDETVLAANAPSAAAPRDIDFEANELEYDSDRDVVTARGNVVMRSDGQSVRADSVSWNRVAGTIMAEGNVRFVDQDGNQLYTEGLELTDKFEAGSMQDMLLALREGGRLAARSGQRDEDGSVELEKAAYSACRVITGDGCPRSPSWRILADRVTYSPEDNRVRFKGATFEIFGVPILPMPRLTVRTDGKASSGFLIPDLRISESNGLEVSGSYYMRLADNRDLMLGATAYTGASPMVNAQYRQLTTQGAYQVTGYLTHSRRIAQFTGVPTAERSVRGYLFANGRFQLSPEWSFTGSVRLASDRTFLRRYDISRDDRLRSMFEFERIDDQSYFVLGGW